MPNILDGALTTPVVATSAASTSSSTASNSNTNDSIDSSNPIDSLPSTSQQVDSASTTDSDSQASSTVTISSTPPPNGQTLGFCYSCNRQSLIDVSNFTCTNCFGGFVELIDPSTNRSAHNRQSGRNAPPNAAAASNDNELYSLLINPLFRLINHSHSPTSTSSATNDPSSSNRLGSIFNSEPSSTNASGESANHSSRSLNREQELENELNNFNRLQYRLTRSSDRFGGSFRDRERERDLAREREHDRSRHLENIGWERVGDRLIRERDRDRESSRSSSSSSSRRRSRSPPSFSRIGSRPFSRSRFVNLFNEDDDMFFDHHTIIITTLINQLRNRGAAPASETQIQNLPVIKIDKELVDNTSQCAICMEDFSLNEEAKKLPCKHLFHDPCIAQWLKLHATCPVCRSNINGEEESSNQESSQSLRNMANDALGPTIFNIIPLHNSDSLTSSRTTLNSNTAPPVNEQQSGSSLSTNDNQNNLYSTSTTSYAPTLRRNHYNLRNHNLYRIHIRQNFLPTQSSNTSSSTGAANTNPPATSDILNSNSNSSLAADLRSSIRITTRLANANSTSENNASDPSTATNTQLSGLNFNQMMQRFMSRYRLPNNNNNNNNINTTNSTRASPTTGSHESMRRSRDELSTNTITTTVRPVSTSPILEYNLENDSSTRLGIFFERDIQNDDTDDDIIEIQPDRTSINDNTNNNTNDTSPSSSSSNANSSRRENLPQAKRRKI